MRNLENIRKLLLPEISAIPVTPKEFFTIVGRGSPMPHTDQEYLGDGVYASYDGYQIWLAANDHRNIVIALETDVFEALVQYRDRLLRKYAEEDE